MRLDDYRELYKKIEVTEEMDEKVRNSIMNRKRTITGKPVMKAVCAAAAAVVLVVGVLQIPMVSEAAEQIIERFTGQVIIHKNDGGDEKIDFVRREDAIYVKIREDAGKEDCKMNSLKQAEKELGVTLLKSKEAIEERNCIDYVPYVSKKGTLNSVMLINHFYATGDLQDVKTTTFEKVEDVNSIFYRSGKKYHSPIMMQISIRSDNKEGVDYGNRELEYAGISQERSEDGMDIALYEMKNLGVKAVITTLDTDGPNAWRIKDGEITSCTDALFVYKGVEYRYVGAVSQEVMEEFLESLAE